MQTLHGPAAVLAATNSHPYARFGVSLSDGAHVRGAAEAGAVVWVGRSPYGWVAHGLGDVSTVVDLVDRADFLGEVRWINLPRHDPGPGYVRNEEWDLLWATSPAPPQPGGERVVPVDDEAAVGALLDVAFPDAGVRPGSPHVLGWYGVWADGSLVACAADRSTRAPGVGPVGVIGGVAVHPEHRRSGLGAAVTGELTRRLQQTHDMVALGVDASNTAAIRMYERLGYAGRHEVTSVRPSTVEA